MFVLTSQVRRGIQFVFFRNTQMHLQEHTILLHYNFAGISLSNASRVGHLFERVGLEPACHAPARAIVVIIRHEIGQTIPPVAVTLTTVALTDPRGESNATSPAFADRMATCETSFCAWLIFHRHDHWLLICLPIGTGSTLSVGCFFNICCVSACCWRNALSWNRIKLRILERKSSQS